MTTREFDPVFSAALRNELEALADGADAHTRVLRPVLRRPQVWITAATALLLVVATLGVLQITGGHPAPAGGGVLTDAAYAANGAADEPALQGAPVSILLEQRARGTTTFDFTVPADATAVYTYVTCSPRSPVTLVAGGQGRTRSSCSAEAAVSERIADPAGGAQHLTVGVPDDTRFSVFAVAVSPASGTTLSFLRVTQTPGTTDREAPDVTDPRSEILDPDSDVFIRQTPEVLLDVDAADAGSWTVTIPEGVTSIRQYVNCEADTTYDFGVDGGISRTSCEPTAAGTFMDTPVTAGAHTVTLRPAHATAFSLLVIATPVYTPTTTGPSKTPLPYPTTLLKQSVLGHERGDSQIVEGRLAGSMTGVDIVITCKGTGSVTVPTDFGTLGSPADRSSCGPTKAKFSGGGVSGSKAVERPRYTITPYGDVSWTVTFMTRTG